MFVILVAGHVQSSAGCILICIPIMYAAPGLTNIMVQMKLPKEQEACKERGKERRMEKNERKEKREKSKRESKNREHGNKKRKREESDELPMKDGLQTASTVAKKVNEQLEKSGLTEDHGPPCAIQEPCESSESTQNSSKSRKIESSNISSGSHGSTIIRLRLHKHKGPKPTPAPVNDEPLFSGRITSKDMKATSAREGTCFAGRTTTSKVAPSSEAPCFSGRTTSEVPTASRSMEEPCFSGRTSSKDLKVARASEGPSSSGRATTKDFRTYPASSGPSFSGRAISKDLEATPSIEAPLSLAGRAIEAPLPHMLSDNAHSQPIKGSKQRLSAVEKAKSTETSLEKKFDENAHIHPSSSSKGSKRERQYRDLIVNWKPVPLPLDAEQCDEDLSWLMGNSGQHRVKPDASSCGVSSSDVDDMRRGSGVCPFQPKAVYLPELEMYQLPYVVPF